MAFNLLSILTAEGVEVENTTDEGALHTVTFAANSLQAGKVYEFDGACIVNDNNGTDTLTLRLRFGASATPTSNTEVVVTAAIDVADADAAVVLAKMHVRSVGTAGVVVIYGAICQPDAIAVGTTPMFGFAKVITGVNTTAALYLQYTADWSAAHVDNEVAAVAAACAEVV